MNCRSLLIATAAWFFASAAHAELIRPQDPAPGRSGPTGSSGPPGTAATALEMARRYELGDGLPVDKALSADYWGLALQDGHAEGLAGLRRLAEAGSPDAQYLYGRQVLVMGQPAEGMIWLRKAADSGLARANFTLASVLAVSNKSGERREAVARFQRAGQQDPNLAATAAVMADRASKARSGRPIQLTPGVPAPSQLKTRASDQELDVSLKFWGVDHATHRRHAIPASVTEGREFELIEGFFAGDPASQQMAFRWMERECGGRPAIAPAACLAFVNRFQSGRRVDDVLYPEWRLMTRAVDIGNAFELGIGTPVDYAMAKRFYVLGAREGVMTPGADRAADLRRGKAQYRLAGLAERGLGMPRDAAAAMTYLRNAAENGHGPAAYKLAQLGMAAPSGSKAREDVPYMLRVAANGGIPDAAFRYAELVRAGVAKPRNPGADMFKFYTQAVKAGDKRAFVGMGRVYRHGWGADPDPSLARQWFDRAAAAGSAEGLWMVGVMTIEGGDPAGAIPWMRKAAQAGYPGAQAKLNEIVAKGYRERSLGNFLLSGLELVGDVAAGAAQNMAESQAQYQRQLDDEIRRSIMVNAGIYASGGYTQVIDHYGTGAGANSGGGDVANSASTAGANSGEAITVSRTERPPGEAKAQHAPVRRVATEPPPTLEAKEGHYCDGVAASFTKLCIRRQEEWRRNQPGTKVSPQ